MGNALVNDPRVDALTFTASLPVGQSICQQLAPRMARVQLEIEGKNAPVVLDDASPTVAASIAAAGGFGLTGQACTATSGVICTPGIKPAFIDESERFCPSDGLDDGVLVGPVVSQQHAATNR